jgi:hypothetical protein
MAWAQEQTPFLRTPSQRLVLWYLCINAFRHSNNREGREPGDVLSAFVPIARVQRGTGLSKRQAIYALQDLQDAGYIIREMRTGNGKSRIAVFWSENFDQIREDFRAGVKPLPKQFSRTIPVRNAPVQEEREGNVIPFPKVQPLHE